MKNDDRELLKHIRKTWEPLAAWIDENPERFLMALDQAEEGALRLALALVPEVEIVESEGVPGGFYIRTGSLEDDPPYDRMFFFSLAAIGDFVLTYQADRGRWLRHVSGGWEVAS